MEYSEKAFVKDFVSRTKENIDHGNNPYEVTQLINSLIGLLILPKEKYYERISNRMVDKELLEKVEKCVIIKPEDKALTLRYIIRRMRNAIAHFHIDFKIDANTREISEIIFSDYDDQKDETPSFKISLSVELVKLLVYQFSDKLSQSHKNNKRIKI